MCFHPTKEIVSWLLWGKEVGPMTQQLHSQAFISDTWNLMSTQKSVHDVIAVFLCNNKKKKNLKQWKCPIISEWLNKQQCIHTRKSYSAMKRNELFTCATICKFLKGILLGEQNQSQNVTDGMIPLMSHPGNYRVRADSHVRGLVQWGWGHYKGLALGDQCGLHPGGGHTSTHMRVQHSKEVTVSRFSCKCQSHGHYDVDTIQLPKMMI